MPNIPFAIRKYVKQTLNAPFTIRSRAVPHQARLPPKPAASTSRRGSVPTPSHPKRRSVCKRAAHSPHTYLPPKPAASTSRRGSVPTPSHPKRRSVCKRAAHSPHTCLPHKPAASTSRRPLHPISSVASPTSEFSHPSSALPHTCLSSSPHPPEAHSPSICIIPP